MELHKKHTWEIFGSLAGGVVLAQLLFLAINQRFMLNPLNIRFIFVYFSSTVAIYMGIGVIREHRSKRRIRELAKKQAAQRAAQAHDVDWTAGLRSSKQQDKQTPESQNPTTPAAKK